MQSKLTLKHLCAYLPYGLKGIDYFQEHKLIRDIYCNNVMALVDGDTKLKPILRPLSDLTKEIEHNGESFVFSDVYLSNTKIKKILGKDYSTFNDFLNDVDYNSIQLLFKYHFDVFGLIDKGLAIDINTL